MQTDLDSVDDGTPVSQAESVTSGLVAYRPGLSFREAKEAALTRFLPGAGASLLATLWFMGGVQGVEQWIEAGLYLAAGTATLTVGFAAGLELLRRHLYPDARVSGRRSVIAGLLAPPAIFATLGVFLDSGVSVIELLGLFVAVPAILAVLMFFAWLTPTPEELLESEFRTR